MAKTSKGAGETYATREAAVAAAMAASLQLAEPGDEPCTITACRCNRQDLHSMSARKASAVMDACPDCERIVLGAPGQA